MPKTKPSPPPSPLLFAVKDALRLKTDAFNGEITGLIDACRADLEIAGVSRRKAASDKDPMIQRAVILYNKAYFGNSPDSEKFRKSYEMQKRLLCLAGDYH